MTASLDQYAERVADLPYLGRIMWYSVTEHLVPADQVRNILAGYGLEKRAPKAPAASDVFRRVTKSMQRNRIEQEDGTYLNLLIRAVADTGNIINRRAVVETVDAAGQTLDYTEVWDFSFDKEKGIVHAAPLAFSEEFQGLAGDVRARYAHELGKVDAAAIRTMIRKALLAVHAIPVRKTGGVLFVPRGDGDAVLDALEEYAEAFPGNIDLHSLPLVDDPKQQAMVGEAVREDALTKLSNLLAEARKETAPSARRAASMLTEARTVKAELDAYQDLLAEDLTDVGHQASMLDMVLLGLIQSATTGDDDEDDEDDGDPLLARGITPAPGPIPAVPDSPAELLDDPPPSIEDDVPPAPPAPVAAVGTKVCALDDCDAAANPAITDPQGLFSYCTADHKMEDLLG